MTDNSRDLGFLVPNSTHDMIKKMLKLNLKKFTQKWNKKKGNPGNKMKKPQSDWSK